MFKIADKGSMDPLQNKIRSDKKAWNKEMSLFIDNVINFKKTINGQPSKYFKEKSKIGEPIPANPTSILSSLMSEFQKLTQKSNDIVQQQINYSKTRRKKQPKTNIIPSSPSENVDLSKQLSAEFINNKLIATGSNSLTRFFARLLNPAFGDSYNSRVKKYRMSLLKSAVDISKNLEDLQKTIVGSSPESIFAAAKDLYKIEKSWSFFKTGLIFFKENVYAKEHPKTIETTEGLTSKVEETPVASTLPTINVNNILADFKKNSGNFLDVDFKNLISLFGMYKSIKQSNNKENIDSLANDIKNEYQNILNLLNAKYGTSGTSLADIWKNKKTASVLIDNLETIGQNWLGKMRHRLGPGDKTSAARLDIYKISNDCREFINQIMDSLEKEMNIEILDSLVASIDNLLKEIKQLMVNLEGTLHGKGFNQSYIDLLDQGKITQFDPNLTQVQKDNLQRSIERRRLKELTDIYQGK